MSELIDMHELTKRAWLKVNDFLTSVSAEKTVRGLVSKILEEVTLLVPFGGSGNVLEIYSDLGAGITSSIQSELKWIQSFNDHYSRIAAKPVYNDNIISANRSELKRINNDEYYYDFLVPQKINHCAGFILYDDDNIPNSVFLFNRTVPERMFPEKDLNLLRIIQPHISNYFGTLCLVDKLLKLPVMPAELEKDTRLLSPREAEIVYLLFRRYRPADIAKESGISVLTVRKHIQNIYYKLKVRDRQQLFEKLKSQ